MPHFRRAAQPCWYSQRAKLPLPRCRRSPNACWKPRNHHRINTIRKHLSSVKGGWLAKKAAPATILSLILSDVGGDQLDMIASGPTVPDPTTFQDALDPIG